MESKLRIAIVNDEKCKPKRCKQECKKNCPVNKADKMCIEVERDSVLCKISQTLCIGCAMCVKKCPFQAIRIINLPKNMDRDTVFRYRANSFKLVRLPTPRPGQVLGLVGTNGIGKSTALQILAGKKKPNLGRFDEVVEWAEIINHFKGSELQNFFKQLLENELKAAIKPQDPYMMRKALKGKVGKFIEKNDEKKNAQELIPVFQLEELLEREIADLSGGELQRLAILLISIRKADILIFDEPSSYLDIKQRLKAAQRIRDTQLETNYVIVVEHDLSVLDYMSDFVCCLYGEAGAYGIVTFPMSVREGINVFLEGFIPAQNMRFRDYELNFKMKEQLQDMKAAKEDSYQYGNIHKKQGTFELEVCEGYFKTSQIVVMLGENGTGKTTFIKILSGRDKEASGDLPKLDVSVKPQEINPKWEGTVKELLYDRVKDLWQHPKFVSDVCRPLKLDDLLDLNVTELSGGEQQRVALVLSLCRPAHVYLIDEPSANLDSELRVIASKVIKRYILNTKRAAFVVEHDFIMSTYLADQVIVFQGKPGVSCKANSPQQLVPGMNKFLEMLGISFRRDPSNFRPRINKLHSVLDKEQKASGNYFCLQQ